MALTSEPQQDVTVTLTPGGGLKIFDPASSTSKSFDHTTYTLGTAGVPETLDLVLDSVYVTDKG
ncbi:MAG: hypothetical protein U0936_06310 [Planctomycetaceae bacterium]